MFQPENLENNKNKSGFEHVNNIWQQRRDAPHRKSQLALACVHHRGKTCPTPGTTKIVNFNQNIGALSMKLTSKEMVELESFVSEDLVKGDSQIYA